MWSDTMRSFRIFVWNHAIAYLKTKAEWKIIRQHMELTEGLKPSTFSDVYCRFLMALANRQAMVNSIGDVDRLRSVYFDFNHLKTLDQCGDHWELLFDTIQDQVAPTSRMDKGNPKNYWVIFCKGSLAGAKYFSRFANLEEYMQYVDDFDEKINTRPALPFLMSEEIFGYGFALACDFLKELGFTNYVKPDVHLIDIFSGMGLASKSVLDVFRTASLIADDVGETPYAVDKAFWLIGSGNLYLVGERFKTSKKLFIGKVLADWDEAGRE